MFLPTAKPVYLVRECGEFIAEAELEDARLLRLPSETIILLLHVFVQHLKTNQRVLTLYINSHLLLDNTSFQMVK